MRYYSSHGYTMNIKRFIETEVIERRNYSLKEILIWIDYYFIKPDSRLIWLSPDKFMANRYNLPAQDYDNYQNIPEDELDVVVFDSDKLMVIEHSNDGDDGFLCILDKELCA